MSRWEPNARGRLVDAALELYVQRGFEQTTVAEIALRAGLTERTFYRYFSDKREVLFWGAGDLHDLIASTVTGAPRTASAMEAVAGALVGAGELIGERREFARERQKVIDSNPELKERELIKLATMTSVIADALRRRGVGDPRAALAAEVAIAAFRVGFERWINDTDSSSLPELILDSLRQLKSVTAE